MKRLRVLIHEGGDEQTGGGGEKADNTSGIDSHQVQ